MNYKKRPSNLVIIIFLGGSGKDMTLMPNIWVMWLGNTEHWDKRQKCSLEEYHTVRMHEGKHTCTLGKT